MGSTKPCPKCSSTAHTRSRRRALEYLLLGLRPFRCLTCQRRFYGPKSTPATIPAPYIEASARIETPSKTTQPMAQQPIQPAASPASPWFLIQDVQPQKVASERR